MDVSRIITSTSAGPRGLTDQLFLIAIAHAGPFKSAAEWRPFALTYAMSRLGCAEVTAIKALDRLEANGWITSRIRRGCPTQFAINESKLTSQTSEGGTTQTIVGGGTPTSLGGQNDPTTQTSWGQPPKQVGVNHPNKLGTDQSSSESFRESPSLKEEEDRAVPTYLSASPADLVDLVFLLNRKGKHRVMEHGFKLEKIVRLGNEDLNDVGITTPEERAKWLLAGYRELLTEGKKAAPVEWICDRAVGQFTKSRKSSSPTNGKRRRIDCETNLDVWAQIAKDLEKK